MATTATTRPEDDWRQFWLVGVPALEANPAADLRRCANCGRIGREGVEVMTAWHWQGGKGHVLATYCRDVPSCFGRREREG